MAVEHVGLVEVRSAGLVVLRWQGLTRSPRDALWVSARLRKPAQCIVSEAVMAVGEMAFRPVGNQDYRSRRLSQEVVWLMICAAVAGGHLERGFKGWSEIEAWYQQTGLVVAPKPKAQKDQVG